MSRFFLIDHSLKGVGGHHFEYAAHVLAAAERAGFSPVLATNRRFHAGQGYAPHWPVLPIFRYGTYSIYTLYRSTTGGTGGLPTSAARRSLWSRVTDHFHTAARNRRIAAFSSGLAQVVESQPLERGDHVFIPTLSELDFTALATFLEAHPQTTVADWHLQFHYDIFMGRDPDYATQGDRLAWMRKPFADALPKLSRHRLHFYNTTEQLTSQYARMNVAPFETLPYPVNAELRAPAQKCAAPKPLRVTCLGAIRAEKGASELATVVGQLWDRFRSEDCQLIVQSNKRRFRLPLPVRGAGDVAEPVIYAPHPLSMPAYVDLIRRADVGLLLYDADRYYVRCSGVLVELLTVGTPVVVTAGTWMAEQIAEENFAHLDRISANVPNIGTRTLGDAGRLIVPQRGAPSTQIVAVPPGATHAVVSFRGFAQAPGTYIRLESKNGDASTIGARSSGAPCRAILPAPLTGRDLLLSCQNAYSQQPIAIHDARVDFLSAAEGTIPLGSVGLIAADNHQVARLLENIIDHWPHYRRTALEFAAAWSAYHNADRIISELLNQTHVANRAA